jgi:hypothetical protein
MKIKNYILALLLVVLSTLLLACQSGRMSGSVTKIEEEQTIEDLPETPDVDIATYTAVIKDTVWAYEGSNYLENERIWIDYIKDDVFQVRVQTAGTILAKVYEQKDGMLYEVATIENAQSKKDYTHLRSYEKLIFKLPLENGQTWFQEPGVTVKIESMDEVITLDTAEVTTMKVITKSPTATTESYFAAHKGLVKKVTTTDNGVQEWVLTDYTTNTPIEETLTVYFMDGETETLAEEEVWISIRTNEEPRHFFTDILKKPYNNKSLPALPQGITIEAIDYKEEDGRVIIELDKDYDETVYVDQLKTVAIKSLMKTIGAYYQAEEVQLVIDGKMQRVAY